MSAPPAFLVDAARRRILQLDQHTAALGKRITIGGQQLLSMRQEFERRTDEQVSLVDWLIAQEAP